MSNSIHTKTNGHGQSPRVREAIRQGRSVAVVENEANVALLEAIDVATTTRPEGLSDAHVVVLTESTKESRRRAEEIAQSLVGMTETICILEPPGGINAWLEAGGTKAELRVMAEEIPLYDPENAPDATEEDPFETLGGFTALELQSERLPDMSYVIDGLLPEGTTLLAAPPKVGKTFFAQNAAVAIASGGKAFGSIDVQRGTVLFLALESSKRSLKKRLRKMLGDAPWPKRLRFYLNWRPADKGGIDLIRRFVRQHPDTRLIVIDTLKRIRGRGNSARNVYDEDYEALQPIAELSNELGVSILIIHHTNKRQSDDPMDLVSGSTGLTGAVDNVMIMQKMRGQMDAKLIVIPREEEEQELAFRFDQMISTWILTGNADEVAKTRERQEVLDLLRSSGGPLKTGEVASALGKTPAAASYLLKQLESEGLIYSPSYGSYDVIDADDSTAALDQETE